MYIYIYTFTNVRSNNRCTAVLVSICVPVCLCACVHEEMRTMNGGRSKYLIFVIRMNFSKYKKV